MEGEGREEQQRVSSEESQWASVRWLLTNSYAQHVQTDDSTEQDKPHE